MARTIKGLIGTKGWLLWWAILIVALISMTTNINPLLIELTNTISLVEAIYTIGGIIGLIYSLHWTFDAERDRNALVMANINGGRLIASRINLTIGYGMSIKMMGYMIIGASAMTTAGVGYVTVQGIVTAIVLLSQEAVAVWIMTHITYLYDLLVYYYDDLARKARQAEQGSPPVDSH